MRSAERIAFHLLKQNPDEAMKLADAIRDVKTRIQHCSICYNLTEADPCYSLHRCHAGSGWSALSSNPRICWPWNRPGFINGVYHVLLGRIAPLEGIGPAGPDHRTADGPVGNRDKSAR